MKFYFELPWFLICMYYQGKKNVKNLESSLQQKTQTERQVEGEKTRRT